MRAHLVGTIRAVAVLGIAYAVSVFAVTALETLLSRSGACP